MKGKIFFESMLQFVKNNKYISVIISVENTNFFPNFYYYKNLIFIAECIYCLVMISIDLSKTAHFAYWKSETMSETIFF